jgi:hypothetical protein
MKVVNEKSLPLVATIEPVKKDQELKVIPDYKKDNIRSRSRGSSSCEEKADIILSNRCNSLDSVLNIQKITKNLEKLSSRARRKKKERAHNSDTDLSTDKKSTRRERRSSHKDEAQKIPDDWIEKIPIEERKKVPPTIPRLQNLFYSATQLRTDSWWDIELMNINKLLKTQANIKFYCYDTYKHRLEAALSDGKITLFLKDIMPEMIADASKTYSQYLLFRNYKILYEKRHSRRQRDEFAPFYILGVAKLDSGKCRDHRYPITFLSLSRFQCAMPEFEQSQGRPLTVMHLSKAKKILEAIKSTLEDKTRIPTFPEYFVSRVSYQRGIQVIFCLCLSFYVVFFFFEICQKKDIEFSFIDK